MSGGFAHPRESRLHEWTDATTRHTDCFPDLIECGQLGVRAHVGGLSQTVAMREHITLAKRDNVQKIVHDQ